MFSILAVPVHIHANSVEGFPFPTPSKAFIICRVFDDSHPDWCEVYLGIVLIYISLIISNVEHSHTYWPSVSPLEKCRFRGFAHFLLGCLSFWYWAVWAVYIFWKLSPVSLIVCKYFLSFHRLSFPFVIVSFALWKLVSFVRFLFFFFNFCFYFFCLGRPA